MCYFSEFRAAHLLLRSDLVGERRSVHTHYEKRTILVVKVNCDASVRGNGFVLCDNLGGKL